MGFVCAVVGCSHRLGRDKHVKFFTLPSIVTREGTYHEELCRRRQRTWLANLRRTDIKPSSYKNVRVCSDHFRSGKPSYIYHETDPDWAPTLNLGHDKINKHGRAGKAKRKKTADSACDGLDEAYTNTTPDGADSRYTGYIYTEPMAQLSRTQMPWANFGNLGEGLQRANAGLYDFRGRLPGASMDADWFRHDDEKVKYYTGLPTFAVLMTVFEFVSPFVGAALTNAMSKFEEMIVVLMRLRLNAPRQDLAFRFNVSVSTVNCIFDRWIPVLGSRLSFLIHWPERDTFCKAMPLSFKLHFGDRVAMIMDCLEVFVNRPLSTVSAQSMPRSGSKRHDTVKFLMGLTPQGFVSFMSEAWGGSTSDKNIIENCSLLDNLLPGDVVLLADRAHENADGVGFYCAKVASPALTGGKSQLSALEIEEAMKIANVSMHVGGLIGLVREKYEILQATLPTEFVTCETGQAEAPIETIARICCCLTNLSPSAVPLD